MVVVTLLSLPLKVSRWIWPRNLMLVMCVIYHIHLPLLYISNQYHRSMSSSHVRTLRFSSRSSRQKTHMVLTLSSRPPDPPRFSKTPLTTSDVEESLLYMAFILLLLVSLGHPARSSVMRSPSSDLFLRPTCSVSHPTQRHCIQS